MAIGRILRVLTVTGIAAGYGLLGAFVAQARPAPPCPLFVARWAHNPLGDVVADARWIAPPQGLSPRGWVHAIARAFDAERGRPAISRRA